MGTLVPLAAKVAGQFNAPGDGDVFHDLLWHVVKKDEPLVCFQCGQAFVLEQLEDHDHHH